MTETRLLPGVVAAPQDSSSGKPGDGSSHHSQLQLARPGSQRKNSSFLDPEFLAFLESSGVLDSFDEDPSLASLVRTFPPHEAASAIHPNNNATVVASAAADDAAIAAKVRQQQPYLAAPQTPPARATAAAAAAAEVSVSEALTTQPSSQQLSHRAVITTLRPLANNGGSGAFATTTATATAGPRPTAGGDDDTASVLTLPMPAAKRRRTGSGNDDDEVTSSPNDLVEVAAPSAAAAGRDTASSRGGRGSGARDQRAAASAAVALPPGGSAPAAATPACPGVRKAILVSKVLTKSDATSKRIILPRIAVETNLPQLASATVFHFSAADPSGAPWPLVVKAWANGSNPKPVYVLEQVGDLLKQARLGVGDAVALLASETGEFYLEWNTEQARAAAARPTYSAITFGAAARPAPKAVPLHKQQPAAAGEQQQQQQQGQDQAPATAEPQQQQQQQQQQQPQPQPQPQQPQQLMPQPQQPQLPRLTAVPAAAAPLVSGAFIPTSPCQLLVANDGAEGGAPFVLSAAHGDDAGLLSPSAANVLRARSDAVTELPDAESLVAALAAGPLHSGGFLLCPRTPGCTRPAGHQGWCLGHKGAGTKRRRGA